VKQLKVRKHPETKLPAVECHSCDLLVSPKKNPLMDGFDCSSCGHVFQQEEMFAYSAAVEEAAEEDEDQEYGY
jgi:DNA-directed RNA polymerase subunit M/transcription elongation factor TFIIS